MVMSSMMHDGLICITFCMSVTLPKSLEKSHISGTVGLSVTKFSQGMDVDDPKVDLEGKGHRSKVKVTSFKYVILGIISLYMVHLVYTAAYGMYL